MSTIKFSLAKILHLIQPEQPVEIWIVGIINDFNGNPIWLGRTVEKTTAKTAEITYKPLPSGCDLDHPIIFIKTIGFRLDNLMLGNKKSIEAFGNLKELSNEQFFKEFEENFQIVKTQTDLYAETIDIIRKGLNEISSSLSKL